MTTSPPHGGADTESGPKIAAVEDDAEIRDLVVAFLRKDGFGAQGFANGAAFEAARAEQSFDLVILDIMIPGEDGLSICRRLVGANGPAVIILSAKGEDLDRIIGLEVGADDYLPKPFNPRELTARIRSVLRRRAAEPPDHKSVPAYEGRDVLTFAGWRLDVDGRSLTDPNGAPVTLSAGEFALLVAFVQHPRRVVSRDQLIDWTRGSDMAPVDRAIDVQLSRLRRKLGDDPKNPALIKTVRGDGYVFAAEVLRSGAP